jgi:hypothetical protein
MPSPARRKPRVHYFSHPRCPVLTSSVIAGLQLLHSSYSLEYRSRSIKPQPPTRAELRHLHALTNWLARMSAFSVSLGPQTPTRRFSLPPPKAHP